MKTIKVENSSNLKSVSYSDILGQMVVTFNSDTIYRYNDVDRKTIEGFEKSKDKGKYFYKRIRDKFPYVKVL